MLDKHIPSAREIFQLDFTYNIINHIKWPLMKTAYSSSSTTTLLCIIIIYE